MSINDGAKFLHNNGIMFDINRKVLHPLGLEMQVEKTEKRFSLMIDKKKVKVDFY